MKKLIIAGVVAITLGGAAFAFAANLPVTSTNLAAGSAAVLSCGDSVSVAYTTSYDAAITGYAVTKATVSGVTANCAGQKASLELTKDPSGTALAASTSNPVTLAVGANDFTMPADIAAGLVTGVSIVIAP